MPSNGVTAIHPCPNFCQFSNKKIQKFLYLIPLSSTGIIGEMGKLSSLPRMADIFGTILSRLMHATFDSEIIMHEHNIIQPDVYDFLGFFSVSFFNLWHLKREYNSSTSAHGWKITCICKFNIN